MKKQQLGKKLAFRKSKVSNLETSQLKGGTAGTFNCPPPTLGCTNTTNGSGNNTNDCETVNASCSPTLCETAMSCLC